MIQKIPAILFVYFLCELLTWPRIIQQKKIDLDEKGKRTAIRWIKISKGRLNSIEYEKFHLFVAVAENYLRREWNIRKEVYSEIRMDDSCIQMRKLAIIPT